MIKIYDLLSENRTRKNVEVYGWVKTFRANRFISINDGSTLLNLQCVINFENFKNSTLKRINTGASLKILGDLVYSEGKGQNLEIEVSEILILGDSDPDEYPIQPKKHSLEFLREKAHLRARTNTFNAVMKIRSVLAFAVHEFFQKKNFNYLNTPIITGSDAEGAGEMFKVTTLEPDVNLEKPLDYKKDFFGKKTHLTVSGQLEAESYALALGNVYTFGPTFRAENSNTKRHLAEFWMIEPEMAFFDLNDNMDLAEQFIKYLLNKILSTCQVELNFLNKRLEDEEKTKPKNERNEMGLIEKIKFVNNNDFKRISYTDAIEILRNSKPNKKNKFKYKISDWGTDLQSEHERFLVEKYFKCPLIIFDYPAKIKAFYMRLNQDKKTVGAMDVLFPGIGEIIGGSQREERLDVLIERMENLKIDQNELWWYLELRKFGSAPHSGFGLGFERLVQFSTGMNNIRDVIPFPRTPQNASF
ncbi:MAG: asparagine--tRNA ligase [Flavobacteriaceae bacterium]|jgi:asparaginyl-tRNA synthetase|nr:asparagine--tRNA ligase [Flavobacteriaceae bacterium]|tara:strand:+ start:697 stop:2115 length:1419 start_codon:yes stop_codon:yes gene_type:complete